MLVEPDVGVVDLHPGVLVRDLGDGVRDFLAGDGVQQPDVGDLHVHLFFLGERQRPEHVGLRDDAEHLVVVVLRRDDEARDVLGEHPLDGGLDRLARVRGEHGARHQVVDGQVEHPVEVAGAVALALSLLVADDEVHDVVGRHDADEFPVVDDRQSGDAVFAQAVDGAPDAVVVVDRDDVLGVYLLDGQRVEVLQNGVENGVFGDDAVELLALVDGGDFDSALDEDAGDFADVLVAVDTGCGLRQRRRLRVVLDVALDELSLADDPGVLAVLSDDDALRVLPLEDGSDLAQPFTRVYLDVLPDDDISNVHDVRDVDARRY